MLHSQCYSSGFFFLGYHYTQTNQQNHVHKKKSWEHPQGKPVRLMITTQNNRYHHQANFLEHACHPQATTFPPLRYLVVSLNDKVSHSLQYYHRPIPENPAVKDYHDRTNLTRIRYNRHPTFRKWMLLRSTRHYQIVFLVQYSDIWWLGLSCEYYYSHCVWVLLLLHGNRSMLWIRHNQTYRLRMWLCLLLFFLMTMTQKHCSLFVTNCYFVVGTHRHIH
mmetsp:Transcript_39092/g.57495  ORF Transcript_39092/g.57495 Transcript_39092/m.57495 type:complete len:220 (+) Transcript_39092:79-738(+)